MRSRRRRCDDGFTLTEVLVTLAITGVLAAIAAPSFMGYRNKTEHRNARDEVVSALRNSAERALSEGRTYCVHFSGTTWQVYRFACAGATARAVDGVQRVNASGETLTVSFTPPSGLQGACPTAGSCAYFYPRGNAAPGTATVSRSGQPDFVIRVEGLTSRVYVS